MFRLGSPGIRRVLSTGFGVVNGVVTGFGVDVLCVDDVTVGHVTVVLFRSPVLMRSPVSTRVWSPQQKKSLLSKSHIRLESLRRMVPRNGWVFASEFPIARSADNLGQDSIDPHRHSSSLAEACGLRIEVVRLTQWMEDGKITKTGLGGLTRYFEWCCATLPRSCGLMKLHSVPQCISNEWFARSLILFLRRIFKRN